MPSSGFAVHIFIHGYLMQKSKYWRKYIKLKMDFVTMMYHYIVHVMDKDISETGAAMVICVQSMIVMFMDYKHEIPVKLQSKYDEYIAKYRKEMMSIYHQAADVDSDYNKQLVRDSCASMMRVMEGGRNGLSDHVKSWMFELGDVTKQSMQCLWIKCDKKAKDLEDGQLRKCSRCRVARYCSKQCQKRDWKYGQHKEICNAFVSMTL